MYFYIDVAKQSVTCFGKMGAAAKHALASIGVNAPPNTDPVKVAVESMGQDVAIVNLSQAFDSIADSDDQAAQELAMQFKKAVDDYYGKTDSPTAGK